jgi:adenosylcobinamide kinase/adenosylcobinamide-phosphate guanylyltransferase
MSATFVTGPVRSGKSAFAARLAAQSGRRVTFLATAARDAGDPEWIARIERHRAERPAEWQAIETTAMEPTALLETLAGGGAEEFWIFDALGTWLATRLFARAETIDRDYPAAEAGLDLEASVLADALLAFNGTIAIVGEQVGWDVVPERASARLFRDVLGRMERRIAMGAQRAVLLVSGLPLELKA